MNTSDPYKVLGVSPDATDKEIKKAYRELAKKYHPDNYAGDPLSDLAREKMLEINNAYDEITRMRREGTGGAGASGQSYGGNYGGYGPTYGYYSSSSSSNSQFADIRRLIAQRRIAEAEELLEGVPQDSRDAEWHFLKGSVLYSKGWLEQAQEHFTIAMNLEPNNPEYRAAYNRLAYQRSSARSYGFGDDSGYRTVGRSSDCSGCDMCTGLICADCCCECMGGDFIRCC